MTLTNYPELEQGSQEWHDQRRGILTASVVGRLLSVGPKTAIDYPCPTCVSGASEPCVGIRTAAPIKTLHPERGQYATEMKDSSPLVVGVADGDDSRALTALLVAERITGHTDPTYMNDDMFRGVISEPIARDKYAEHHGVTVTTTGFVLREEADWTLGYSPDGLVGDDGLLEVKAPRAKTHLRTILADQVPAAHMAQLQTGLLVTGRKWIDFASFCGGMPLWVQRVYPDPRWHEALIEAASRFQANAAAMTEQYAERTKGLATTEPLPTEMEMSL